MENRETARTCVLFMVLFVVVVHGRAARPLSSGCNRMPNEQNELQAHAPGVAAAGPMGTGGDGVDDQKNFLPLGGVGMGAGIGGYAGMGGYLGGVMPTLGGVGGVGSGGFGAGVGAGVGGIAGAGLDPLGGLGGLDGGGLGPGGNGVPLLPYP